MRSDILTTDNPISTQFSGNDLAQQGSKGQATQVTAQVIPSDTDSDFRVDFQVAVVDDLGRYDFTKIGSFTEEDRGDNGALASAFPISLHAFYRFEHISGIPCRVRLTG